MFNKQIVVKGGSGLRKSKLFEDVPMKKWYHDSNVLRSNIEDNYDFYRWEEDRCPCSFASVHEVEILYYTEDYLQNLRKEWELSMESEQIEDRNWRLLKKVEELMDKA